MTEVMQIREAAGHLPAADRADLAAYLLETLDDAHYWVEDAEVAQRRDDLTSGKVAGLTRSEFDKACGR